MTPPEAGTLDRFVDAQHLTYAEALAELHYGRKTSHWMWYVFPQIAGLGSSATARHYAIADLHEARDYLAHSRLGPRLAECTEAVTAWAGRRDLATILGTIEAMKFRSSMTLFEAARAPFCGPALQALCGGARDARTLDLLGATDGGESAPA